MHRLSSVRRALAVGFVAAMAVAAVPADPVNENGYEVTRSQTVLPVPRGKLGRKTIDRETRVGNTAETDGNSSSYSMTFGGFVNRCPIPEGGSPVKFVVPGDVEFTLVADSVDTGVVPTARHHIAKSVVARVKAFVNDDLSVTDAEFDGTYTTDTDGVRSAPVSIRRRFQVREGGAPDMASLTDVTAVTGDLAAAALMWNAGQVIFGAQKEWFQPNACAEVQFEPRSEERTMGPNETQEVRVKLVSRENQAPIPAGKWDASPVGGGRVVENRGDVREDGTFVVKYTARADPREGDGAAVEAVSPAGYARGTWKIRIGGDYELRFESSIVSHDPAQSVRSSAHGSVRLKASTKPWRRKPDGKLYLLYDGRGTVQFSSAPGPERDECDPLISGSGTSELTVVETLIEITPPSEQSRGTANVQMTYSISMGAGETEMTPNNVAFRCVPGRSTPFPYWWSSYLSAREPSGDVTFLGGWEYVGRDDVVARKVLTGNCAGLCDEERSVFTLRRIDSR